MRLRLIGFASFVFLSIGATAIAEQNKEAFFDMCHGVSLNDGLNAEQAQSFCTCLTEATSDDEAIYSELFEAGTSEPDLATRLASLSEEALSAAGKCQPPAEAPDEAAESE